MNGFSETVNSLTSAKANSIVDGVSGTPTLTVGNNDATSSYSGVIANSAGLLSLTKIGTGTLTLSGVNTYGGATVISNGTLVLSGSISNSASIHIAAGATFDVSGITAYTLSASNTLSAAGTATTANFKGKSGSTVSLGSRPITLTYNGTNPALTVTQGTLVLNGNPFTVNSATVLADGTYTLVSQTSGSITSSGPYPDAVCLANGSRKTGTISVVGGNVLLKVETKGTLIQFF